MSNAKKPSEKSEQKAEELVQVRLRFPSAGIPAGTVITVSAEEADRLHAAGSAVPA